MTEATPCERGPGPDTRTSTSWPDIASIVSRQASKFTAGGYKLTCSSRTEGLSRRFPRWLQSRGERELPASLVAKPLIHRAKRDRASPSGTILATRAGLSSVFWTYPSLDAGEDAREAVMSPLAVRCWNEANTELKLLTIHEL